MGYDFGAYSYIEEGIRMNLSVRELTKAIACGAIDADRGADALGKFVREHPRREDDESVRRD